MSTTDGVAPGLFFDEPLGPVRDAQLPQTPAAEQGRRWPSVAQVLAFERRWWRRPGSRVQAIWEEFGLSDVSYAWWLNRVLDTPEALELEPVVVRRLQRLRAARVALRSFKVP